MVVEVDGHGSIEDRRSSARMISRADGPLRNMNAGKEHHRLLFIAREPRIPCPLPATDGRPYDDDDFRKRWKRIATSDGPIVGRPRFRMEPVAICI